VPMSLSIRRPSRWPWPSPSSRALRGTDVPGHRSCSRARGAGC
jgi:hypothetical protein